MGDETNGGLDRRALIRRAAAVGVGAWTAPMIVDSVLSPAAAITGPPKGCTGMLFNGGNCNLENQGTPCSFTLCDQTNDDLLRPCVILTGDCQNGPLMISIAAGCNCVITRAAAKSGNDCIAPVPDPPEATPAMTVTFPPQSSPGYAQFAINVVCT